ncbi:MAG TPA: hypothetical protein PLB38_00485 [bacterium]|nr:hypothetical protein [bacterium]
MQQFKQAMYRELFVNDCTNMSYFVLFALVVGANLALAGGLI